MRFHILPIEAGVAVEVWDGRRTLELRGFCAVAAACHFIDNYVRDPNRIGHLRGTV